MTKEKNRTFEDALKRLEEIVASMEDEHTPLEEALQRYEEGIKLARFCAQKLDAAEKKIEILSKSADGEIVAAPFPGADSPEASDQPPAHPRKPRSGKGGEQYLL